MKGKPSAERAMRMSKSSQGAGTERTLGQGKLKNLQRGHRAECSLEAGRGWGVGAAWDVLSLHGVD